MNSTGYMNFALFLVYILLLPTGIYLICDLYQYFGGYPSLSAPNVLLNILSYVCLVVGYLLSLAIRTTILKIYQVTSLLTIFTPVLLILPRWEVVYENNMFRTYILILIYLLIPFLIDVVLNGRKIKLNNSKILSERSLFAFALLVCAVVISVFPRSNFYDMLNIYENRVSMRDNMPTFFGSGYLYGLASRFFIPLLIAISVLSRSHILLFMSCGCGLLMFSIGSHKSIFGIMVLSYIIAIIVRKGNLQNFNIIFYVLLTLNTLIFVALLANTYIFFEYTWLALGDILRRISILPALLFIYYTNLEYFLPLQALGEHFMDGRLQFYVGENIFGRPGMRANATSFGMIPLKYGYIGSVVFTTVTTLLFVIVDSYIKNINNRINKVFFVVTCTYMWSFLESQITVVIFTHGFWFLICFLLFSQLGNADHEK
jgi:hypothetical protein